MKTFPLPRSVNSLATRLYYRLVYTLTALLSPPIDDSPEALNARNLAAIAKGAALLPVNANKADLAAQCIAAQAHARKMLRLLRQCTDDIGLTLRMNARYGSMMRTSLSVHAHPMRMQAVRHKREVIEGATKRDARTQHVAKRSMLTVAVPEAPLGEPAWPTGAPIATPTAIATPNPIEAPAATPAPKTTEIMPKNETKSHGVAFETWLNMHSVDHESDGPKERKLRKTLLETIRQATQISPTR